MTIDLIKQFEAVPASYPAPPSGLSTAAAALDANMIWARIEEYTAFRYRPREVVWTLIGDGGDQWYPPLAPVVSREVHVWQNETWEAVTLLDGPLGICLPYDGTFKITAQVGVSGTVPAPVSEAFRRLAEYSAEIGKYNSRSGRAGATSTGFDVGELNFQSERALTWAAKAMQLSGAGDLLRNYRRA